MPYEKLQKLMDFYKGTGKAAKALGVTERTFLNFRQRKVKVRKPFKVLLEYFAHEPEQFREVCSAVAEGRPVDWNAYERRVFLERLGRLTDKPQAEEKDDGADLQV